MTRYVTILPPIPFSTRQISFIVSLFLCAQLTGQSYNHKDCYSHLENDTLSLGNSRIERQYVWNQGDIIPIAIENKENGNVWSLTGVKPASSFPSEILDDSSGKYTVYKVESTSISPEHLKIEIVTKYGQLFLKRNFRIYPNTSAIACDFYVKGSTQDDWLQSELKIDGMSGVEKNTLKQLANESPFPVLDRLVFGHGHWKLNVIDFKDATDINNNLIKESLFLSFTRPLLLKGNLVFAKDLLNKQQLFLLKEAPLSDKQLSYPGYDFFSYSNEIHTVGLGVKPSDLKSDKWIKGYSVVVGVAGNSELSRLSALRTYQKQLRVHDQSRDEMIMMNTWGDRGQDGKLNEKFVLKELDAAARLGITHFQIDDGWQKGLSKNSTDPTGKLWNEWDEDSWGPHPERFPKGLKPIVKRAKKLDIQLALWFHPSDANSYANWKQDAEILLSLHKEYGIKTFKIDGIELPDKEAETNLRNLFDCVLKESKGNVLFNLDATAGRRGGYHFIQEYGNVFLENRYTDWANYYPHWTLRNAWLLSRYIPLEKLQLEFLNKWRNVEKYGEADPFTPSQLPFDYQFAITMMAQPLAWFEGSNLPEEAFSISPIINEYKKHMYQMHVGTILPIGQEPSGSSWTGFQSVGNNNEGYLLIFRERNDDGSAIMNTWLPENKKIVLSHILGDGQDFETTIGENGSVGFDLPRSNSFGLYKYRWE